MQVAASSTASRGAGSVTMRRASKESKGVGERTRRSAHRGQLHARPSLLTGRRVWHRSAALRSARRQKASISQSGQTRLIAMVNTLRETDGTRDNGREH
eukprot:5704044-Prymnesium_polylepis.1